LRRAFLRKIEELAPEVLQNLLDAVLSTFTRAAPEVCAIRWTVLLRSKGKSANRLAKALLAWGRRHNLTEDWLLDLAVLTLFERAEWEDESAARRQARIPPTPEPAGFARPRFVDIEHLTAFQFAGKMRIANDGWVPAWLTWAEYESTATESLSREVARLRLEWQDALRQYRRAREQEARQRGLSRTRVRREVERHLEWLVRWQVLRQDRWKIARESGLKYGRRADTIRDAIKSMARDLGLENLRKGHPGRPPA
jgi:hypothetical protein